MLRASTSLSGTDTAIVDSLSLTAMGGSDAPRGINSPAQSSIIVRIALSRRTLFWARRFKAFVQAVDG
jgi:hypothetical protein